MTAASIRTYLEQLLVPANGLIASLRRSPTTFIESSTNASNTAAFDAFALLCLSVCVAALNSVQMPKGG